MQNTTPAANVAFLMNQPETYANIFDLGLQLKLGYLSGEISDDESIEPLNKVTNFVVNLMTESEYDIMNDYWLKALPDEILQSCLEILAGESTLIDSVRFTAYENEKFDSILEDCTLAFFAELAKNYPAAVSGDINPLIYDQFIKSAKIAAADWISQNTPA